MRFNAFSLVLVTVFVLVCAEPEPDLARGLRIAFPRSRGTGIVKGGSRRTDFVDKESNTKADMNVNADTDDDADDDADIKEMAKQSTKKADPSKGRLFFNKLLLFRNVFGQQQQQPIIPIIVTGGPGTAPLTYPTYSSPTTTGSLSPTSPAISGSVATSPAATAPAATGVGRVGIVRDQQDQTLSGAATVVNEQELQAALAGGAQEYVVTDQEIRGTSDAKANRVPSRVNLRRVGANRGQTITVRIPARYRKYFKNGQKVMLNAPNRNRQMNRRATQRRRNNRNRRRRVGGKRRRVNN
ncbi:uncharacterized protein [Eurosta solidaginis]|uniref:uncharacterized protein n=1 Tax=Eurosta solidaginis TaxID=178769 RepID=UPI003530C287